jgi:predicted alpha/beta hydrolase
LLTVPATDGFPLAASWHGADQPARVALVAPATGVRRRLYENYAGDLARRGFGALTWDWRGTGDSRPRSLRGFPATMRGWAEHDFEGVLRWARERFPAASLVAVGHSFGGQAIGLAPSAAALDAAVTVAAQSGYWGHWPRPRKYFYALLWHTWFPALTRICGYFPGRLLRMGADLPTGVALEWARWCRSPDYLGDWRGHAAFAAPILAVSFADDDYAPRAAVEALHAHYGRGDFGHCHVQPREVGLERIGHFGFFRPGIASLWSETAEWLTAHTS